MKILFCTDGSKQSQKALEVASQIAAGCNITEVVVMHVFDEKLDLSALLPTNEDIPLVTEEMGELKKLMQKQAEERDKLLEDALKYFKKKSITAKAVLKKGHPVNTIVKTAREEGFDMIIMGKRGFESKKGFLGSVSSAVVNEAENCTVVIVK